MMPKALLITLLLLIGQQARANDAADQFKAEHAGQIFYVRPHGYNSGGGTGFLHADGHGHLYIVTNEHVCSLAPGGLTRDIASENGLTAELPILAISLEPDLCLIEPPPGSVHGISGAPYFDPKGEVIVLGHPKGQPLTIKVGYFAKYAPPLMKTSALVWPGNSGSPLLNRDGELLGVIKEYDTHNNFSFAIPLSELEHFIADYEASGARTN